MPEDTPHIDFGNLSMPSEGFLVTFFITVPKPPHDSGAKPKQPELSLFDTSASY